MGYLGLSVTPYKEDNLLQRLFWPSDHAGEADTLGQQGFWICSFVALLSCVILSFQGHWILGVLSLIFFGLGGMGVREHSTAAAILLVLAYIILEIGTVLEGRFPGFLDLAFTILLMGNIRGTWIAKRWAHQGDPEAFPERMRETWKDRLVDQLPARAWPKGRIVFFLVSAIYLSLLILGAAALALHSKNTAFVPQKVLQLDATPRRGRTNCKSAKAGEESRISA